MLRAVKIRLYPNKEQELKLNKVLGCYRFVYNQMLALKQHEYNENKKSLGFKDLSKYFHGTLLKDEQYEWLSRYLRIRQGTTTSKLYLLVGSIQVQRLVISVDM